MPESTSLSSTWRQELDNGPGTARFGDNFRITGLKLPQRTNKPGDLAGARALRFSMNSKTKNQTLLQMGADRADRLGAAGQLPLYPANPLDLPRSASCFGLSSFCFRRLGASVQPMRACRSWVNRSA